MTDRALELDDIQGNILAGFNTDFQMLLALTVPEPAEPTDFRRAAKWLVEQAQSVTVVSEVRAQRNFMKSAQSDTQTAWLCIAVGQRLLKSTHPDLLMRDAAFNKGMLQTAPSALGDKTDKSKWRVGSPTAPVDIFLIVAANNETAVTQRADNLSASAASAGLVTSFRELAERLDDDREHFGFRDGISQPKVIGYDSDGEMGAGNFVFGYPQKVGTNPYSPAIDPKGFTDNGSLLVFRWLTQDVRAFRQFLTDEVARLAPQWPGLTTEHLAALLVGRWPSGALVKSGESQDPGGSSLENGFDFSDDTKGISCPFAAHIRKVNPRSGPKDVADVPRMLRRGIPFGTRFDIAPNNDDRGLAFLAFQTSVQAQFEFITRNWMNSATNPGPGHDLLVGRSQDTRKMMINGPNGWVEVSAPSLSQWVIPTGGAYLFVPSRSALMRFADPPTPFGFWKVKQFLFKGLDAIRGIGT